MSRDTTSKTALFVSRDLLFAGKIQAAAEPQGMRVVQETDPAAIERVFQDEAVPIVFLDLNATSPTLPDVMSRLPEEPRPLTVAFGPHVNTARLNEAREAGCDQVLPRSRFVKELPELLKQAADRTQ